MTSGNTALGAIYAYGPGAATTAAVKLSMVSLSLASSGSGGGIVQSSLAQGAARRAGERRSRPAPRSPSAHKPTPALLLPVGRGPVRVAILPARSASKKRPRCGRLQRGSGTAGTAGGHRNPGEPPPPPRRCAGHPAGEPTTTGSIAKPTGPPPPKGAAIVRRGGWRSKMRARRSTPLLPRLPGACLPRPRRDQDPRHPAAQCQRQALAEEAAQGRQGPDRRLGRLADPEHRPRAKAAGAEER